jgi:hypothetical protein
VSEGNRIWADYVTEGGSGYFTEVDGRAFSDVQQVKAARGIVLWDENCLTEKLYRYSCFSPEGLAIAQKTLYNFVQRAIRLYEQEPPSQKARRLGEYVKRWRSWVSGGANTKDISPATPSIRIIK